MLFPVILSTVLGIEGTNYTQHSVSSNNILESDSIAPLYLYSNVLNFASTGWCGSGLTFNETATSNLEKYMVFQSIMTGYLSFVLSGLPIVALITFLPSMLPAIEANFIQQ